MKANSNSLSYVIGAVVSLVVALAIWEISKLPYRLVFSIIFGAIAFFVFLSVTTLGEKNLDFSARKGVFSLRGRISNNSLIILVYAICIAIVLLVSATSSGQFIDWVHISIANYIRLFAGILLSSILPGYGLLKLVDRAGTFSRLESLLFSFFISVFLMAVLTFSCIAAGLVIDVFWVILLTNLIILLLISVKSFINRGKTLLPSPQTNFKFTIKIDYIIILLIFLFFIAGWVVYYSSFQLGSPWDMWDHYYTVSQVSSGYLLAPSHFSGVSSESWFALHYIAVWQLTGFPQLNGYLVYAFINFFYILAFYLMVKGLVGNKYPRLPIIATVIATLFAGFGWIEALYLSATGTNWLDALTFGGMHAYNDIIYSFVYGPIPQYFSLSAMFALIYLMTYKGRFTIASAFLTIALIAQGLLVHSPETLFLILIYLCYLLFAKPDTMRHLKRYSISIIFGLLVVFLVGLPFLSHFYFNMQLLLPLLLIAVGLTFAVIYAKPRIGTFNFPRKIFLLIFAIVWILYLISFVAWKGIVIQSITDPSLNIAATVGGEIGLKPWYLYPINSGISLLTGLLGLTYVAVNKKIELKNSRFLAFLLACLFAAGILLSIINTSGLATAATYWEKRVYNSFMIIPLSIFGAFIIIHMRSKLWNDNVGKKIQRSLKINLLVGLIVAIVVTSGVASTVLSLDYISKTSSDSNTSSNPGYITHCSQEELAALNFLRLNAPSSATVLGISSNSSLLANVNSNRLAYIFSGLNHLNSPYWFTTDPALTFANITNPVFALKVLYSLNITYLFVTHDTKGGTDLQLNGYVAGHLLSYLPPVFNNSEVTIYQIPKMNPPSSDSNLTLVIPRDSFDSLSNASLLSMDSLALSGLDYSIKIADDGSIFDGKYILLPSDEAQDSIQMNNYNAWVENGGHLIEFNSAGSGVFAAELSEFYSNSPTTEVVANYTSGNQQSSPLAFTKQLGKGEIMHVNISPFFEDTNSRMNFPKLGTIFDLLGLNTPKFIDTPQNERWKYAAYDLTLVRNEAHFVGSIILNSTSLTIPYKEFKVSMLDLNGTGTINELKITQPLSQQSVTIKNLAVIGHADAVLDCNEMSIIPSNLSYSEVLIEPSFNISMKVPEGGITFSALTNGNDPYNIHLDSGTMVLEGVTTTQAALWEIFANEPLPNSLTINDNTLILANAPSLSITGNTSLSEPYIPSYIHYVHGDYRNIIGQTFFTFDSSSDNVLALTNFTYKGEFQPGQPTNQKDMVYWEFRIIFENLENHGWQTCTTLFFIIYSLLVIVGVIVVFRIIFLRQRKNREDPLGKFN
jgi:hypothetical protein